MWERPVVGSGCVPKFMSALGWKKVAPTHWAFIEHLMYTWPLWGTVETQEFARARTPYARDRSQMRGSGWWHKQTLFTLAHVVSHALSLWISRLYRPRMRPSPQACALGMSQSNCLTSIIAPNTHCRLLSRLKSWRSHQISHLRNSQSV